jgi:8-oxo-dGTP diphosphatase
LRVAVPRPGRILPPDLDSFMATIPSPWLGISLYALVCDDAGRVLLVQRSPLCRFEPGCWEPPGGKPEPGENLSDALAREVCEETGLEIEVGGLAGAVEFAVPGRGRVVALVMNARRTGGVLELNPEHSAHAWASAGELAGYDLGVRFGALPTWLTPRA